MTALVLASFKVVCFGPIITAKIGASDYLGVFSALWNDSYRTYITLDSLFFVFLPSTH